MTTRPWLIVLAAAFLAVGCEPENAYDDLPVEEDELAAPELVETPEQAAMRRAIEQARDTVQVLLNALNEPETGPRIIEVKVLVRDEATGVTEALPLRNITYADGQIRGVIDAQPLLLGDAYKVGDPYTVAPKDIIDWYIIQNKTIRGGYTLRVLRERMKPEDRNAFDEEMGVTFD